MKKVFFVLLTLGIYCISNAQFPNHKSKMKDLHENILHSDEIKEFLPIKPIFPEQFNNNHNYKSRDLTSLPDSINMVISPGVKRCWTYKYNSSGNITTFKSEYSDSIDQKCEIYNLFYDSYSRLETVIQENCSNESEQLSRESYFYGDCDKPSIHLAEEFENGKYVESARLLYTYNDNCQLLSLLFQQCFNNQWFDILREIYTYDSLGNILSYCWEKWDGDFWESGSKEFYTYDSTGRLESYKICCENDEKPCSRYSYFYNENGELWYYICDEWNDDWQPYKKNIYLYENKNISSLITEYWKNDSWIKTFKTTFTYTDNNLAVTQISGRYENEIWKAALKTTNIYDQDFNKLSEVDQKWKDSIWTNIHRIAYTYDGNGNSLSGRNEIWNNDEWELTGNGKLLFYSDNKELFNFYYQVKNINLTYYEASLLPYDLASTHSFNRSSSIVKIFPNPASTQIKIETPGNINGTIIITDLNGQKRLSVQCAEQQTVVSINDLSPGLYFVRIEGVGYFKVGKFVKHRQF